MHFSLALFLENEKDLLINESKLNNIIFEKLAPYYEGAKVEFKSMYEEMIENYENEEYTIYINEKGDIVDRFHDYKLIKKGWGNEIFKTFDEFMEKMFSDYIIDYDKKIYGYWYNPNYKWDWYEIGGRWNNILITKENSPIIKNTNKIIPNDEEYKEKLPKGYILNNGSIVKDIEFDLIEKIFEYDFSTYAFFDEKWIEKSDFKDEKEYKKLFMEKIEQNQEKILIIIDYHI